MLLLLLSLPAIAYRGQADPDVASAPGAPCQCMQDCLEPEVFAEGEYILQEGAPLGSDAKFYLIESGTVTCLRTAQVQAARGLRQACGKWT